MASKIFDNFEKETFTVLTPIGIKAIQDFNDQDTDDAKIIIKGSTNLKYITPPRLLTDKAYYDSNPVLKSCDLDAIMYLQDHHTEASIDAKIINLIDILYNSNFILKWFGGGEKKPGYGIYMVEAILAKYDLSIYLGEDKGKPVLITDIFSGKYPIDYMKQNLIKHRRGMIMSGQMRKDDVGLYIFNKATGKLHVDKWGYQIMLSIIELTYILKKTDPLQIVPRLYYTPDAAATPIYFQSPEWHAKYGGHEDHSTFERVVPLAFNPGEGHCAFLSLAYIIHELARGINYGFGPYKSKYDKRDKARVRLNYVLKLIKNNQISGLYTVYDKTFRNDEHFADFIDYLYNRYYDPVKNPKGDPMFDFENNKVFVNPGELAGVTLKQILDNVKLEAAITMQNMAEEDALVVFGDTVSNPTAKMILAYLTDNNFLDVIRSYANGSADYAVSMLGWYYTGDDTFLKYVLLNNLKITVKEYHDRLTAVFAGINPLVFNAQLPDTYTLYKGVRLFNVVTTDGSYLRFNDIDLSKPHFIHNPIPSSTSFNLRVADDFIHGSECCILRITMRKHHKVLIFPHTHLVTGMITEHEVLLPSNAIFQITNVEYKYSKNIGGSNFNKYNLILIVDCNYLHPDDGDVIPGYKTSKGISSTPPPPVVVAPPPPPVVVAPPPPPVVVAPPPPPVVVAPAAPPKQPAGPAVAPANPVAPKLFGPKPAAAPAGPTLGAPGSASSKTSKSKSKSMSSGWGGLSGGRIPKYHLQSRKSGSRKQFIRVNDSKSKKSGRESSARVSKRESEPITYTVIFSDIFGGPCCTAEKKKGRKQEKAAFDILNRVFSHPNAPTNRMSMSEDGKTGLAIAEAADTYMTTIREFAKQNPEYEYLLLETNMNKLRETYESVVELQSNIQSQRQPPSVIKTSAVNIKPNRRTSRKNGSGGKYTKKNNRQRTIAIGPHSSQMVLVAGAAG